MIDKVNRGSPLSFGAFATFKNVKILYSVLAENMVTGKHLYAMKCRLKR